MTTQEKIHAAHTAIIEAQSVSRTEMQFLRESLAQSRTKSQTVIGLMMK